MILASVMQCNNNFQTTVIFLHKDGQTCKNAILKISLSSSSQYNFYIVQREHSKTHASERTKDVLASKKKSKFQM